MPLKLIVLFALIVPVQTAFSGDSLFVTRRTHREASVVVKELKERMEKKGFKIFTEIQHHEEAKQAGEQLRFTYVIIFGNPKSGTKLMQCDQRIGYELPLRILVTTDTNGQTLISFKDPKNYSKDYALKECQTILEKMSGVLHELTSEVLR
jgi:uncharacterized protein (DUF302 family)